MGGGSGADESLGCGVNMWNVYIVVVVMYGDATLLLCLIDWHECA
jgi:hypothetical protein